MQLSSSIVTFRAISRKGTFKTMIVTDIRNISRDQNISCTLKEREEEHILKYWGGCPLAPQIQTMARRTTNPCTHHLVITRIPTTVANCSVFVHITPQAPRSRKPLLPIGSDISFLSSTLECLPN